MVYHNVNIHIGHQCLRNEINNNMSTINSVNLKQIKYQQKHKTFQAIIINKERRPKEFE